MNRLRLIGRCGSPGADGPNRFIGQNRARKTCDAVHRDHRIELPRHYGLGPLGFALLQGFAQAEHRNQSRAQASRKFACHQSVIFMIQAAPLGMPDNHVAAADVLEHGGADLPRESALALGADILRADADRGLRQQQHRIRQVHIRRKYRDIDRPLRLDVQLQLAQQGLVCTARSVHFPISCHHRTTHRQPSGFLARGERRRRLASRAGNCKPGVHSIGVSPPPRRPRQYRGPPA